jgi:dolichol-phosphate mannosyltransferase
MPEITVVIPTLDERENVVPILRAIEAVLSGVDYEVLFVDDDSQDDTASLVRGIAQSNPRVRVLERIGRRGLSSAVIEGMMASSSPYLAVMDSDLQHDEKILPLMLQKLRDGHLDLVIATRHSKGGSVGAMAPFRRRLSRFGQYLSSLVCRSRLSDPMSGYFAVSREYLNEVARSLSGTGFKVLLDLVVSSPRPLRFAEVPYHFRQRIHGRSKLDILVSLEYLELIADKLVGNFLPVSYVVFGLAGSIGILAHLAVVNLLRLIPAIGLERAQLMSSAVVIGVNFVLNNQLTFRSTRLTGAKFLAGMAVFYAACSVGLFVNLRVLEYLTRNSVPWYLAAAAGLAAGSVWNYWMSAMFVWQVRRRRKRIGRTAAARM